MAIEPTPAVLAEVIRFAHRNAPRFVQIVINHGDEVLWSAILDEITNDERHENARKALDILWGVGLRDGSMTLGELVAAADWTPPDAEA